jgi:hypothetical protein
MLLQPSHVPDHNRACEGEWLITYDEDDEGLEAKHPEGFPCLRLLDNDKTVEEDLNPEGYGPQQAYENAEIPAGAVFDLGQHVGWNQTLALYLEASHLLPEQPESFDDVGTATARAHCALTDCQRLDEIVALAAGAACWRRR